MRSFVISLAVILLILSCEDKLVIDEPVGYSDFYIQNDSDQNLEFKFFPDGDQFTIRANSKEMILEKAGGDFGMHALPTMIYSELEVYLSDIPDSLVYSQKPIDDSLWDHSTPDGYVWWEYAEYTLVLENSDLNTN